MTGFYWKEMERYPKHGANTKVWLTISPLPIRITMPAWSLVIKSLCPSRRGRVRKRRAGAVACSLCVRRGRGFSDHDR